MIYQRLYPTCAREKLPIWGCPNFIFTILGLLNIGIMIGTYLIARLFVSIEFLAMLMIISASILLILNYLVSQGVNQVSQAKRTAEQEKTKTEAIIRYLSDGLIMLDNNCRVVMVNPLAEKLLGINGNQAIGQDVRQSKPDFGLESFFTVCHWCPGINQKIKNEVYQEEITLLRPRSRVLKVQTTAVQDSKRHSLGFIKVLHDITREKQLDEIKSDFISIASHQLKTPLSTMKWNLEILAKQLPKPVSSPQLDLIGKTIEANEEMIQIVRDLLDVSRIEQGRLQPRLERASLNEVISAVTEKFKLLAEKKNISLKIELPSHRLKQLLDVNSISVAINNLIDNSLKYTPGHGHILVKLTYEPISHPQQSVITVQDNGLGIPRADQDKLFTKFFRAKNISTMSPKGTGLGLYIAKNIVERHDGRIHVKSEEKHGTVFTIILPLKYLH